MLDYLAQLRRLFCLAASLALAPLLAAETAAAQLHRLRDTRLDASQCYRVRDLFLERDDVKLYFTDGHLLFATPFDGRTIAAFFVATAPSDEGEIILLPPTERERKSLARFTGQPILNEKFRTATLFFTDDTADVLKAQLAENSSSRPDPEAGQALAPNWTPVLQNIFEGLALRTLIDLTSDAGPAAGYFTAAFAGGRRGRFDVRIDRQVDEEISVGQAVWDENRRFYEIWCQFSGRSLREGRRQKYAASGRLEDFHIETRLSHDLDMQVWVRATLVTENLDTRIVAFELSPHLRLTGVRVDGEPVEFLQFEEFGSSGIARRLNNLVAIVLPEEPASASSYSVDFRYEGTVISDAGDRVYYVGSRGSWYPKRNPSFTNFELLFHYPEELDLVATGEQIKSSSENGIRSTLFRTSAPIRVAGFNLGDYERASRQIGPYTVEVCANKGIEAGLQPPPPPPTLWVDPNPPRRRRSSRPALPVLAPQAQPEPPAPAVRLEEITDHSAAAVQFFHDRFGPLPVSNVIVSPIPGGFGQGFPGLVYASTLSYFGPEDAPLKEYSPSQQLFFSELLRTHEIAYQWWGNVVSTGSPTDVWLTEALATYSGLLFLEDHLGKDGRDRLLAEYRDRLLERNESGEAVEAAGAIVLGERLRSSQFPNAARVIVYEKGAWIVHMLRGMMGDSAFLTFLRHLCETYRLELLTTADFQKEAVKFLPLDWPDPTLENFFDQWVYSTGIPSLDVVYSIKGKSPRFRLTGRLMQKSVPESFSVLVPIEIHTLPGRSLVKWISTEGTSTEFSVVLQNKPTRVVIDPAGSVLLRPRS